MSLHRSLWHRLRGTQDRPLIGSSNCRSLRKFAFSKARIATEPVRLANEDVDVDRAIGDVRKD
jgi:hypothetical protein